MRSLSYIGERRPSKMEGEFRVAVLPCSGIGRLVSTVVRQAAYRIQELRPDEAILVASGRAASGEEEAVEIMQRYPVLLIDGTPDPGGTAGNRYFYDRYDRLRGPAKGLSDHHAALPMP